jgi:hypothetical protein
MLRTKKKERVDGDQAKETLVDVPLDAVGKAAESYLYALREVESAKKHAGTEGAKLIRELKASGRGGIRVQGIFLSIKTIEASEKIVLKRE